MGGPAGGLGSGQMGRQVDTVDIETLMQVRGWEGKQAGRRRHAARGDGRASRWHWQQIDQQASEWEEETEGQLLT